jgi:hypothetical protein
MSGLNEVTIPPPPPDPIIEYRAYFDKDGNITSLAMINHPSDGIYIVVSKDEYENYFKYVVKDNKFVPKIVDHSVRKSLKKAETGTKAVNNHAGIVIMRDEIYDEVAFYGF